MYNSCVPPIYGAGAGVAMMRGGLPPTDLFWLFCLRARPQQPPQPPPQQPPPNPPPPQANFRVHYYLSFPPFVGANVKVFWSVWRGDNLPSRKPITLQWQYYPNTDTRPRILTTTTNELIYTTLRPFVGGSGRVYVSIDPGIPRHPKPLIVMQFLYYNQRWIVICHEVYFPVPRPWWRGATPSDYRIAIQNRTEKLVAFYSTELTGFNSFTHRHLTIHLAPDNAFIQYNYDSDQDDIILFGDNTAYFPRLAELLEQAFSNYYIIQPTDRTAYCMFIDPLRLAIDT
jgi:hypothetical protein